MKDPQADVRSSRAMAEFMEQCCSHDHIQFDYEQALLTFRMLADIRFKLLALVPLVSGAAITFLTADPAKVGLPTILALSLFGLLVTFGITVYNVRNTHIMNSTLYRARELETLLMFPRGGQFQRSPKHLAGFWVIPISSDRGLALIYGTVLAAWTFFVIHATFALFETPTFFRWPIDAVTALLTVLVAVASIWEILRLDTRSKEAARKVSSITSDNIDNIW